VRGVIPAREVVGHLLCAPPPVGHLDCGEDVSDVGVANYLAGDEVELAAGEAKQLIADGFVEKLNQSSAP
jgi:hypothetical protein